MFKQRIRRRQRAWWGGELSRLRRAPGGFTRIRHLAVHLSADDSMDRWRSGRYWQRRLANKWNSREFVQKHGVSVPELYAASRVMHRIDWASLPAHFAVRQSLGTYARQVWVVYDGHELIRERTMTRAQLVSDVRRERGRASPFKLCVEAFIGDSARLPVQYRLYAFNGHVAAVFHETRQGVGRYSTFAFRPDGAAFEARLCTDPLPEAPVTPPPSLKQMVQQARQLSAVIGSFVRFDCYDTPAGSVFGEFSFQPILSVLTPAADELFGRMWVEHCPDEL